MCEASSHVCEATRRVCEVSMHVCEDDSMKGLSGIEVSRPSMLSALRCCAD